MSIFCTPRAFRVPQHRAPYVTQALSPFPLACALRAFRVPQHRAPYITQALATQARNFRNVGTYLEAE